MNSVDVIGVFLGAVSGMTHVADYVACGDDAAFLKVKGVGKVLAQMGIVIVALAVEAADADTPAAILVPAKGFHVAGFDCDDGRTDLNKK